MPKCLLEPSSLLPRRAPGRSGGSRNFRHALSIYAEDSCETLLARLAPIAAELLPPTLWLAGRGLGGYAQEWWKGAEAPAFSRDDARIQWSATAAAIDRLVRIVSPTPGAFTTAHRRLLKIHRAGFDRHAGFAVHGAVLGCDGEAVCVQAYEGRVRLLEVETEGGHRMSGAAWARGPGAIVERLGT